MANWAIYTVNQLIDLGVIERPMDGNHGSIHPKATDFVEFGIPFIMASDLKGGRVDLINCAFISEKQAGQLAKGFSKPGDVLLSHKATLGRTAIVQDCEFPFIMLTPQVTYYRIKDRERLNNRFLKYYFNSRPFLDIFEAWAGGGSTRAYLGITAQRDLPIPMPPIEVQLAIAELVGPLDDKIELNRRMNETLEAMARAIFRDWFVDFGPTRTKMAMRGEDPQKENVARAPYLAPDIWSLFPDRLDDDGKPEGWGEAPLTHFFEIIGGGTPKTSEGGYWGGHIPWFSVADTPSGRDTFVFETEKTITESGLENSSARLLDPGQTIISARGTIGNLAMAGKPMAFNQSCYGLVGANGYGNCFVFLAAKHMVSKLKSVAHGSVFSTITRQTFESVHLPAPGSLLAEQFEFATSIFFDRIGVNVTESRTLAATRDLLLPKLMSGEIRVRDAEKLVGDTT